MSGKWFDSNYSFRVPITLDFSGVSGSPVLKDVEIVIPVDWDLFWKTIRSDFKDVVVTDAESNVVDFERHPSDYATRVLTLLLDAVPVGCDNCLMQYFLYFGYADESIDAGGSFSITSAEKGFIELGAPFGRIVAPFSIRPSVNQPQTIFVKSTLEELDIFFAISGIMSPRIDQYNKRQDFETIRSAIVQSYDKDGAEASGRYDLEDTRFINGFVKVRSKAGSADADYALSLQITTTNKQIYDIRCIISVRNLLPD